LTDYDDVRTCGKEGHICTKCWPLMAVAVEVGARGVQGLVQLQLLLLLPLSPLLLILRLRVMGCGRRLSSPTLSRTLMLLLGAGRRPV